MLSGQLSIAIMLVFVTSFTVVVTDFVNSIQAQPSEFGCHAPMDVSNGNGAIVGPFSAEGHSRHHCVEP
jgi:hypothetical protein